MVNPMEIDPTTRNMFQFLHCEGFKPSLDKQGEIFVFSVTDPRNQQSYAVRGDDLRTVSRQMEDELNLCDYPGW